MKNHPKKFKFYLHNYVIVDNENIPAFNGGSIFDFTPTTTEIHRIIMPLEDGGEHMHCIKVLVVYSSVPSEKYDVDEVYYDCGHMEEYNYDILISANDRKWAFELGKMLLL